MQWRLAGVVVLLCAAAGARAQGSSLADAAERRDWTVVESLLAKSADANVAQADGSTALLWAAHHDNAALVSALLRNGADPNRRNRYGVMPLAEAALNGNATAVEALLAAGADANAALPEGDTPLMIAARAGSAAAVRLLLGKGAMVDARDGWHGETALMWAAGENHPEVVRALVEAGADVNARSATFDWKDIKHGGVQSQLPMGGLTALLHAARENAVEAATALLEAGADANLKDPMGISPLRVAISNGHLDLAALMLERGADPNEGALVEAVKFRTTPMMRAATNYTNRTTALELVNQLLARGARADSLAGTALPKKHAFEAGTPAGVSPSETGLYLAAGVQDLELMRLMLAHGANPNHATDKGWTPLMVATGRTTRRPAAAGASDVTLQPAERRVEASQLLLDHGAKLDAVDATGMTALHAMAGQGEDDLVRYLAAQGARLDIRDKANRTPLDVARAVPLAIPGGPPPSTDPRDQQPVRDTTVALLGGLLAQRGIAATPYVAPGDAAKKPVTAVFMED